MPKSIIDRIRDSRQASKQLSEQKRQEVYDQVLKGELTTEEQKELYKIRAQRAILKAKKAVAENNPASRRMAMQELKVAYGFYHYMCSIHDAFGTMRSQMQMQAVTQEFADMVESLSKIRAQNSPVNFAALTHKALKGFQSLDTAGLDKMVDNLVRGSISATESNQADDAFLDALVSGQASLDTPYPSETLKSFDAARESSPSNSSTKTAQSDSAPSSDDIMMLLDQMTAGLKD